MLWWDRNPALKIVLVIVIIIVNCDQDDKDNHGNHDDHDNQHDCRSGICGCGWPIELDIRKRNLLMVWLMMCLNLLMMWLRTSFESFLGFVISSSNSFKQFISYSSLFVPRPKSNKEWILNWPLPLNRQKRKRPKLLIASWKLTTIIIISILLVTFMGRFMKAELVGAKTVQGPAEEKTLSLSLSLSLFSWLCNHDYVICNKLGRPPHPLLRVIWMTPNCYCHNHNHC